MKYLYLFIICLLIFICCNNIGNQEIAYQLDSTFKDTDKIRYAVSGGGEIDFTIQNYKDSLLFIISSYHFQDRNDSILSHSSELDSSDTSTLNQLFSGTLDIGGVIYQNDLETGSWTYLYIDSESAWIRIANEAILNELYSLYSFVSNQINISD